MSKAFRDLCKTEFATYGFTACPLTDNQINDLFYRGFSTDEVYSIGCDTNAGISFRRAVEVAQTCR